MKQPSATRASICESVPRERRRGRPRWPRSGANGAYRYRIAPVSPGRAERTSVITMRALTVTFAVVGLLFLITPDVVIGRVDDLGNELGSFAAGPRSSEKLWLGLAVAYMTVITGIALVVSLDVGRYRALLLVLAAGKAVSSLTCL